MEELPLEPIQTGNLSSKRWEVRLKPVPNILAGVRLVVGIGFYLLLVGRDSFLPHWVDSTWWDYFSALLFVIASITDFFDGFIARNFNAITQLGEILDPLADKLLTTGALLGLLYLHRVDPFAVLIIFIRELFITGLRVEMARQGLSVKAGWSGKVKTVMQMIAIGFLLMDWKGGTLLLWIAVGLTIYSGWEYIRDYLTVIKKQRGEKLEKDGDIEFYRDRNREGKGGKGGKV